MSGAPRGAGLLSAATAGVPSRGRRSALCGVAVLLVLSTAAWAQEFSLDWRTVDGGGAVSESADQQWQLSGTLGQWDGTGPAELAAPGWTLTGGFWSDIGERPDLVFADGFED